MKAAYFDCFSGISGNMILGALIDLGLDIEELRSRLSCLPLGGYRIDTARVNKRGITATYVDVVTQGDDQPRTLDDVFNIIERSSIDEEVKKAGKQIFARLAAAEAKVHGHDVDTVHLYEVGATDTIIDVIGSLVGMKIMDIGGVSCSPLNLGRGMVQCSHGWLPVPAPVTAELVKGVRVYAGDVEAELTTPTGAAIITSVATDFGAMPALRVEGVGYGAGKMDLDVPNVLRIFVGQTTEQVEDYMVELVTVLETNIDDMNPQFYDHIMERLMQTGALDVFLTSVQMKKNRPGTMLSVVAAGGGVEKLLEVIFAESTTLGVRVSETRRLSLPRYSRLIKTKYGEIRVKVAHRGDAAISMVPEYEDCRKAAKMHNVPISQVYAEVQEAWKGLSTSEE